VNKPADFSGSHSVSVRSAYCRNIVYSHGADTDRHTNANNMQNYRNINTHTNINILPVSKPRRCWGDATDDWTGTFILWML